jgi:hypothetical protein
MTIEDIANKIDGIQEGVEDDGNILAIWEIAYQLAKMNERMDKEDEKFFGGLHGSKEKEKVQEAKSGNEGIKQG